MTKIMNKQLLCPVFRLGNCIDLAHKAADAISISEVGMRLLTVTSHIMKALWLLIDHVLWFSKVGLINVSVFRHSLLHH